LIEKRFDKARRQTIAKLRRASMRRVWHGAAAEIQSEIHWHPLASVWAQPQTFSSLERVHFLFNSAVRLAFVETDDDGVSVLPQVSMLDHHCCASRAKLNTGAGCINPI
jgi:hypothetical protein